MNKTGYLIFELSRSCNLGGVHDLCPNQHPERYSHLSTKKSLPDSWIVDIAKQMHEDHGFRGRIGWHYYNEPLVAEKRLWRLMDAITAATPKARYTLWTNGTIWPKSPENLLRFEEVHLTDYRLPEFPVAIDQWKEFVPHLNHHHWQLDGRLDALGDDDRRPCRRMYTEFIVDYFGNVHPCCYDWRGLGSPGNVQTDDLAELAQKWQEMRDSISGSRMTDAAPEVCRRCKVRSSGITRFVPEVAQEAEVHARGLK